MSGYSSLLEIKIECCDGVEVLTHIVVSITTFQRQCNLSKSTELPEVPVVDLFMISMSN